MFPIFQLVQPEQPFPPRLPTPPVQHPGPGLSVPCQWRRKLDRHGPGCVPDIRARGTLCQPKGIGANCDQFHGVKRDQNADRMNDEWSMIKRWSRPDAHNQCTMNTNFSKKNHQIFYVWECFRKREPCWTDFKHPWSRIIIHCLRHIFSLSILISHWWSVP